MQSSDADALDGDTEIFDEDAPLLSGVQLTEGLQHEAHTAAGSQLCEEAAQVASSLQLVIVSRYSSHMAALYYVVPFPSTQQQSLLCHAFARQLCYCMLLHGLEGSLTYKMQLFALNAAQSLYCRKPGVHLWKFPPYLHRPSMCSSCSRMRSPQCLAAACKKSCYS